MKGYFSYYYYNIIKVNLLSEVSQWFAVTSNKDEMALDAGF